MHGLRSMTYLAENSRIGTGHGHPDSGVTTKRELWGHHEGDEEDVVYGKDSKGILSTIHIDTMG